MPSTGQFKCSQQLLDRFQRLFTIRQALRLGTVRALNIASGLVPSPQAVTSSQVTTQSMRRNSTAAHCQSVL